MFSKLYALAALLPLVSAVTFQVPTNPTSDGTVTINWTTDSGDPDVWTLELVNTAFNNAFAIANNVQGSSGSITLTLPTVNVGDGYTLEAVDISNINSVFGSSSSFSIGAATATITPSSTASTVPIPSGSGAPVASGSAASAVTTVSRSSASGFGTTISASGTSPASSVTGSGSTSSASTSSSALTTFNAALGLKVDIFGSVLGSLAIAALGAVVGGAVVAF